MKKQKIQIFAAHPDDEILGCGGSMAKWASQGHTINVVIAAEGLTSRQASRDRPALSEKLMYLSQCAKKANECIGVQNVSFLNFPDNQMDTIPLLEITKEIEKEISIFSPDIVLTHSPCDLNIDHQILSRAVVTATRPIPENHFVHSLLFFEVPSSSEWNFGANISFTPNYFINISTTFEKKIEALKFYEGEMRGAPHARSVENVTSMAKTRGATCASQYAEAFTIGRIIY